LYIKELAFLFYISSNFRFGFFCHSEGTERMTKKAKAEIAVTLEMAFHLSSWTKINAAIVLSRLLKISKILRFAPHF
jgi:hypothetical protein